MYMYNKCLKDYLINGKMINYLREKTSNSKLIIKLNIKIFKQKNQNQEKKIKKYFQCFIWKMHEKNIKFNYLQV